jgi:hypothetical protein
MFHYSLQFHNFIGKSLATPGRLPRRIVTSDDSARGITITSSKNDNHHYTGYVLISKHTFNFHLPPADANNYYSTLLYSSLLYTTSPISSAESSEREHSVLIF